MRARHRDTHTDRRRDRDRQTERQTERDRQTETVTDSRDRKTEKRCTLSVLP